MAFVSNVYMFPCRCSFLLLLITAAGSVWLLENPSSSILMKHDRMQWLIKILKRAGLLVYRQGFWMAHFAHPNFKLTKIWSTSSRVWKLDFGKLTPEMRSKHSSNTTKRYTNTKGEHRFTGTKELKSSQSLGRTSIFSSFPPTILIPCDPLWW